MSHSLKPLSPKESFVCIAMVHGMEPEDLQQFIVISVVKKCEHDDNAHLHAVTSNLSDDEALHMIYHAIDMWDGSGKYEDSH